MRPPQRRRSPGSAHLVRFPRMSRAPSAATAARSWRPFAVAAAVGILVLGALVLWVLTGRGDAEHGETTPTALVGRPEVISEADLRTFARAQSAPVYWAGPRDETTYELTRGATGQTFIRYLQRASEVGDLRARYLSVATYPEPGAYQALRAASRRDGQIAQRTAAGALVVYDRAQPSNVYFAFPDANFQVEVFHPDPARAQSLVLDGDVRPLR